MKQLTEKQKRFVDYYIETCNQTEAARRAGYKQPHVQGNRLLEKVRDEVGKKLAAKESKRIASQDEVLRFYTSIMRNEELEDVVVTEAQGDYTSKARLIQKGISAKDRLKAADSLFKLYAVSAPKQEQEDDPLSASLKALAAGLDSAAGGEDSAN